MVLLPFKIREYIMRENPENTEKIQPPSKLFLHMDILGTKRLIEQASAKTWLLMEVIEKFSSNKRKHNIQYTKALTEYLTSQVLNLKYQMILIIYMYHFQPLIFFL